MAIRTAAAQKTSKTPTEYGPQIQTVATAYWGLRYNNRISYHCQLTVMLDFSMLVSV